VSELVGVLTRSVSTRIRVVRATRINHVSVSARNLADSVRFYADVLGMEPVATPDFGFPVQWMRLGDVQLHLFEHLQRDAPVSHHFAIEVDDFAAVLRYIRDHGIEDRTTFGHWLYRLPDGAAQLYLRDPGGNLVEVDTPDADAIDPELTAEIRPLPRPQTGDAAGASLWVR
jgi:catechol 2,3-dioxygenase-like lactoylglutathione lyase family enzyme